MAHGSEPRETTITVRVRPRSHPGVVLDGDLVVVSVAAPPVEGRATEEARRALAEASRTKVFEVAGLSPEEVARRLSAGHEG